MQPFAGAPQGTETEPGSTRRVKCPLRHQDTRRGWVNSRKGTIKIRQIDCCRCGEPNELTRLDPSTSVSEWGLPPRVMGPESDSGYRGSSPPPRFRVRAR